jgi:two-component system OmpR family response regulator
MATHEQSPRYHPRAVSAADLSPEMRILIIEDDEQTLAYLRRGLEEAGHTVDYAADGRDGMYLALEKRYDAAVIDRMLPGADGLAIVRAMRASHNDTPVLILSALGEVDDRVKGLRAGGDDYLVKPFAFAELLARLDALTRRRDADSPETTLSVGDLEMDLLSRSVRRAGKSIGLQPREFRLLEYLMRHADQVVTRTMLLEGVWDYNFDPQTNVIDVHISRLRGKIDRDFDRPLIHTVRGAGYMLSGKAQA